MLVQNWVGVAMHYNVVAKVISEVEACCYLDVTAVFLGIVKHFPNKKSIILYHITSSFYKLKSKYIFQV